MTSSINTHIHYSTDLFRRRGWARTLGAVKTKDTPTAREKLMMLSARSVSRNMIRKMAFAIRHSVTVTLHLLDTTR